MSADPVSTFERAQRKRERDAKIERDRRAWLRALLLQAARSAHASPHIRTRADARLHMLGYLEGVAGFGCNESSLDGIFGSDGEA